MAGTGRAGGQQQPQRQQGGRDSRRSDRGRCKVATEHETEDAAAEVDQGQAERADGLLHVPAQGQLQQHVEADVDDAGVQEDGDDETEPLVRLRRVLGRRAVAG